MKTATIRWLRLSLSLLGVLAFGLAPARAPDTQTKDVPRVESSLSLHVANQFHKRQSRMTIYLGVQVHYEGALAHPRGRGGAQLAESDEQNSRWAVTYGGTDSELHPILFRLEVSAEKKDNSVLSCKIGRVDVHVGFVKLADGKGLNDVLKLGKSETTPRKLIECLNRAEYD